MSLISGYDAALFDLDGVIYLGPNAVPGAADVVAELGRRGVPVMYVTNNAARSAASVVEHLVRLGFPATGPEVLTSAQVAAVELGARLPAGARILVAGSRYLAELVTAAGLRPVYSADDEPQAVVQGYEPTLPWPMLDEVSLAIQRGAVWYATNDDLSRPTDRGLVPGVGGMIEVVAGTVGGAPITFGKPFRPMIDQAKNRLGARRPIFVGDRIDTDILGACSAGLDSLLVFSGAHGKRDLLSAGPGERPSHIGADLSALLEPARVTEVTPSGARCGGQILAIADGAAVLSTTAVSSADQFDALWALANLSWSYPGLEVGTVLDSLDALG